MALERLTEACDRYGSHGLGVTFDSIAIVDLHPPADVVDAYYEVARAMEQRDRKINLAHQRETHKLKTAAADAARLVAQARAGALEKVKLAEGDRAQFFALVQARGTIDFAREWRWQTEAVDALLRGRPVDEVERDLQVRRQKTVDRQALVDFRLFWETAGKALAGRDLILIDADNVRGQRQLMLFDPDQFRVPIPMFLPPNRSPLKDEGP
jgi:hypothetical protein